MTLRRPNIPKALDRDAVNEALSGLGIDLRGLKSITILPRSAEFEYYAEDEASGRKVVLGNDAAILTASCEIAHLDED